jgi:hypothetical protein
VPQPTTLLSLVNFSNLLKDVSVSWISEVMSKVTKNNAHEVVSAQDVKHFHGQLQQGRKGLMAIQILFIVANSVLQ